MQIFGSVSQLKTKF